VVVVKCICIALVGLLLCASTSQAEDRIEFFADAAMSTCNITDVAPTLVKIHMFQTGTLPADNVIFAAHTPACWVGAIWLGDTFATDPTGVGGMGTHGDLVVLQYRACLQPPVYLGSMNFFTSGQGLPCCAYAAHPTIGIRPVFGVRECGTDFTYRPLSARPAIINGNADCPCELPVSTVETTWGRVKALYH
jgi:hypothetical protein